MKKLIKYSATHLMLALVVLTQLVFPLYSAQATCVPGYDGTYDYEYSPVPSGLPIRLDLTSSNVNINGAYIDMGNEVWVGAFTGSFTDPYDGVQISLNMYSAWPVSGAAYIYKKASTFSSYQMYSATPFTNCTSLTTTVQMHRWHDCTAGYRIEYYIGGVAQVPYVRRASNN
jgi:hypothetical protein